MFCFGVIFGDAQSLLMALYLVITLEMASGIILGARGKVGPVASQARALPNVLSL